MAKTNRFEYGTMVRGSAWPVLGGELRVKLIRSVGWEGAGAWTWQLRISRWRGSGDADLVLSAIGAYTDPTDIESFLIYFVATSDETSSLDLPTPGTTYYCEVQAIVGYETSILHQTFGTLNVIDPIGNNS